jgi:SAM-dependent methyltransferase
MPSLASTPHEYQTRPCPSCGSTELSSEAVQSRPQAETLPFAQLLQLWDTDIFTHKGYFTYRRCAHCALLYAPIYPSDSQLAQLYGSMSPNMVELPPESMHNTQAGYLRTALAHRPPPDGDFLEIGPDQGILAAHVRQSSALHPQRFWFIEPNQAVHSLLSQSVAPAPATILSDLNDFSPIPSSSASLAFMVHVLDHLTTPLHHLTELHRCLQPGGLLSIVVHNERSLLAKLFGPNHPIYCPYHPQLFNPSSLSHLVASAGFEVLSVTRTHNHYPLTYLLKNALFRITGKAPHVPDLPSLQLPIPLGNIQITARKAD